MDKIVDERRRGMKTQFLVRWRGEGPEGYLWLPESELEDCQALDNWIARRNHTPGEGQSHLVITIPPRPH